MSDIQIQQILDKANSGQPEAQFLLSQICLQNQDLPGMVHWLQQASNRGFVPAFDALGHCYEKGQGIAQDIDIALSHYGKAIDGGSALAAFHKAELLYKSRRGPDDEAQVRGLLSRAVAANVVPALRAVGYIAMQDESGRPLAIDCFRRAALAGDVVSSFNLGWILLQGWNGDNAAPEAAYHLRVAAEAQYPLAETFLADVGGVVPSGGGNPASPILKTDVPVSLYPTPRNVEREIVSEDPPIVVFKDVLNPVDRAYLMALSQPRLTRAHVIDPDGGKDGMLSDVRTSMSTYLPFAVVDMIGRYAELKIIGETGEELAPSEPMSILQYAPGEFYRPHFDYFDPHLPTSQELLQDGGQRTASAVTYLVAPAAGGGTSFPNLNLSVPAAAGSTLWFRNCTDDGQIDERSLHAGDTVDDGEKWVVTKWFREKPTQYLEI